MAPPFRRVVAGQRLDGVSADDWNAFIDTAMAARQRQPGPERDAVKAGDQTEVFVKNGTASALPRHGVIRLLDPLFGPGDNLEEFVSRPCFTVEVPTAASGGRIGVLPEPIAAGKIGRATVAGVAVCKVEVTDPTARFAAEKPGTAAKLITAAQGPVQILWRESGTSGDKWAVVRIGGGQAASGDPTHLIQSATSIVGAAKPRWRYTLKRATTDTTTGLVTVDSGALTVIGYNDAEDTGGASNANYQHGQALTINGATITLGPVTGSVPAFWTGLYDGSGVPIYRFNQQNPAASLACA
jgi:hypothetical protein